MTVAHVGHILSENSSDQEHNFAWSKFSKCYPTFPFRTKRVYEKIPLKKILLFGPREPTGSQN